MKTAIKQSHDLKKKTRIFILRIYISTILSGVIFFLAAGQWDIARGWFYYILAFITIPVSNLIVANHNPELIVQRSKLQQGTKGWDKWWLLFYIFFFVYGMPFVAGWDIGRLGNQMSVSFSLPFGLMLFFVSLFFSTWAMVVNRHFEASVRVQTDRDHRVITEGPYRIVRHPGYLALIFWAIGFPLIVGSILALYHGFVLILFTALRTWLEDKTLKKELKGYQKYSMEIRYRLIPYVW